MASSRLKSAKAAGTTELPFRPVCTHVMPRPFHSMTSFGLRVCIAWHVRYWAFDFTVRMSPLGSEAPKKPN